VPVVICTSDVRMPVDERAAALGDGIQVLPKPFDVLELLSALRSALMAERLPSTT